MNMVAKRRHGIDGFHNIAGKIARMRRRETHAPNSRHLANRRQQLREAHLARRIAIRIHILPEQLDVRIASVGHPPRFSQHGVGRPAALFAARIRNHAVGAELVAAFDDGDVAAMRVAARGEFRLKRLIGLPVVQAGDALVAGLAAAPASPAICDRKPTRRPAKHRARARKSLAFLLRHAAKHGKSLPLLVQCLVVVQPVENLLLRLIADGAGVVQNQRGFRFRLDLAIPLVHQRPNDLFGVVDVHLAAESFDVKRLVEKSHRNRSISQQSTRLPYRNRRCQSLI